MLARYYALRMIPISLHFDIEGKVLYHLCVVQGEGMRTLVSLTVATFITVWNDFYKYEQSN